MILAVIVWACAHILGSTTAQSVTKPPCSYCKSKMELGIVLDSSSSIHPDDFIKGKEFIQDFLENFLINQDNVRVSIITYGRGVHPQDAFNLTTYSSGEEVIQAVSQVPHRATDYTATGKGIAFMRDYQLAPQFTRDGVPRVGLVITDGNSQDTTVTAAEAKKAQDEGIQMFAIGVGQNVSTTELLNIAGDNSRVDRVDSYSKLETITGWLVEQACITSN